MIANSNRYVPPVFPPVEEGFLPPNVHIHFHFSPHGNEEDFRTAEPLVPEADIVSLEMALWLPSMLKDINAATVDQNAARYNFVRSNLENDFFRAYFDSLYEHKKPVTTFDASRKQFQQAGLTPPDDRDLYVAGSIDNRLSGIGDSLLSALRLIVERDVIIVGNIGPMLKDCLDKNPLLAREGAIRVLSTLGSEHRGVFEYLSEQPATADQVSASESRSSNENAYLKPIFEHLLSGEPIPKSLLLQDMVITFTGKICLYEILDDEPICPPSAVFRSEKTIRDRIGITARKMMMADIETDASLREAMHDMLNGQASNSQLRKMARYIRKAKSEVGVGA